MVKYHLTLSDFEDHARRNFPDAFRTFMDRSLYKFERKYVHHRNGSKHSIEALRVGLWTVSRHDIPLWAKVYSTNVYYHYGKDGEGLIEVKGPYSNADGWQLKKLCSPFDLVVPKHLSVEESALEAERVLAKGRLALFVKFVFLLTGRLARGIRAAMQLYASQQTI